MAEKHIKKYDNGATFIYYRQNINSTTDVTAGFLCGADRDGRKKGLAHALEHSIFHGTPSLSQPQMYDLLRKTGTVQNAFTTQDYIVTNFDCPNSSLEKILKMNSDMLARPDFNESEWRRERKVILQELYMTQDSEHPSIFDYLKVKGTEKSGEDILGSPKTLSKITTEDFVKYKNKYFVSENLVVSVVSSLPYERVKAMVEQYLIYRFPSKPQNKVTVKKRQYNFTNQQLISDIPNLKSFQIRFMLKGKQDVEKNDLYSYFEDWYFNDFAGKLYQKFRLEKPLVYTASMYNANLLDLKLKVFSILTSPENVNTCIDSMTDILRETYRNGISQEDFELFKQTMLANRERKTDIKTYHSEKLFNDYVYGEKPFIKDFFRKLMSLSLDEINEYLKDLIGNSKLTVTLSGDMYKAKKVFDIPNEPINAMTDEAIIKKILAQQKIYSICEILEKYNPSFMLKAAIKNESYKPYYAINKNEKQKPHINKRVVNKLYKESLTKSENQKSIKSDESVLEMKK